MSKGSAPTPPNPIATAGAQTSSNVSTAVANAFLNNTNQVTPLGSLSYNPTGTYSFADPSTGSIYNIPRFTATQELTPEEQAIQEQSQSAKFNLANLSSTQSGRIGSILGNPFDLGGAPPPGSLPDFGNYSAISDIGGNNNLGWQQTDFGDAGRPQSTFGDAGQQQRTFDDVGEQQRTFDDVGGPQRWAPGSSGYLFNIANNQNMPIVGSYGPSDSFSADRGRVEEALYGRLNPQLGLEQQHIEQQLADQGIRYGSAAYQNAMDSYNRQANDARLAVTQTAGQEQQRMMDMAAKQAGFQNAAQMQDFQEAQQRTQEYNRASTSKFQTEMQQGQFVNSAQQQAYQQALGKGTFANAAQEAAYQQALGRASFANQAQQAAFGQEQARGSFANQAQQSLYDQLQGRGAFANQAQQANFNQAAQREQFYNQAMSQQWAGQQAQASFQNQLRPQYLSEQYARRNQPINEISALLSGSQIQQPGFMQTPQQQIPYTDIANLFNQNFSQQFQNYQQQNTNYNQLLGGLLGGAGNVAKGYFSNPSLFSDRRMKENIHRVGTVFAATPQPVQEVGDVDSDEVKRLPIYKFSYKDDPSSISHIGPMAQDVEKIDPGAVGSVGGRKTINPERVMGSILRAA